MKNLFLYCFIFFHSLTSSSQTYFQKTVREPLVTHVAHSVKRTTDNGYVFSGLEFRNPAVNFMYDSFYLLKSDSAGIIQWTKSYGCVADGNSLVSYEAQPTFDNGFIFCGSVNIASPFIHTYVGLIKTDSQGDTVWTRFFDINEDEWGTCVKQTPDSGFIVVGQTLDSIQHYDEVYVIKVDKNGNIDWSKSYGPSTPFYQGLSPISVDPTPDGGYFISGTLSTGGATLDRVFLLKINSTGNIVFTKAYDSPVFDIACAGKSTPDNGYVIVGYSGPNLAGTFLLKTDSIGDLEWSKCYFPSDSCTLFGFGVTLANDRGYSITGSFIHYTDLNIGSYDKYCVSQIKVDSIGIPQWSRLYGKPNTDNIGNSIEMASDGGFMLAGSMNAYADGVDLYMIKTDEFGNSGCNEYVLPIVLMNGPSSISNITLLESNCNTRNTSLNIVVGSGGTEVPQCSTANTIEPPYDQTMFSLYPNPAYDRFTLKLNISSNNARVEVSDISGKILLKEKINSRSDLTMPVNFGPGLYFVTVVDSQFRSTQKLLVQE